LVLAIDKPAGLSTTPGRGHEGEPPLSQLVREIAPDALPVHRLDRDTSGVILFGLGTDAHRALNAAFESRRAEKVYFALVRGDLDPRAPRPEEPALTRTPLHARSLRVPHPSGRGFLLVEAPLPADLAGALELLRAARRAAT